MHFSEDLDTQTSRRGAPRKELPWWASRPLKGLQLNNAERCDAGKRASASLLAAEDRAVESASANRSTRAAARKRARSSCNVTQVVVQKFEDTVTTTCCPSGSLACAGCAQYDAASDTCVQCSPGFTKTVGEGPSCEVCSDVAGWADPVGDTCKDYQAHGWCTFGSATKAGLASHNGSLEQWVSSGLSALGACCACGGGTRLPTPFEYSSSIHVFPLEAEVHATPLPRVATDYTASEGCNLHQFGIALDATTGIAEGHVILEGPTSVSCDIIAEDKSKALSSTAQLELRFDYFVFPAEPIVASAGQTWTPQSSESYTNFSVGCTPTLPWLTIASDSGTLSVTGNFSGDETPTPRVATCTVSATTQWCPSTQTTTTGEPILTEGNETKLDASAGEAAEGEECLEELHQTIVSIVAPNEADNLYLVHRDAVDVAMEGMELTIGEEVPNLFFSTALSKEEMLQLDAPSKYHMWCGEGSAHDAVTGEVTLNGDRLFLLTPTGEIKGRPSTDLVKACYEDVPRCKIALNCTIYGALPFSKDVISSTFTITVWDNICWSKVTDGYYMPVANLGANSSASCRAACHDARTCAGWRMDNGVCVSVQLSGDQDLGEFPDENHTTGLGPVYAKARSCSPFARCIDLYFRMGVAYLDGEYCPMDVHDQGSPVYRKEGAVDFATVYLHKYFPARDYAAGQVATKCGGRHPAWLIRRHSDDDVVIESQEPGEEHPQGQPAVVELRGEILGCVLQDVVDTVFAGSGLLDVFGGEALNGAVNFTAQPTVYECISPIAEREEYLGEHNIKDQFGDDQELLEIFRFDDVSTALMDDYSMSPCECAPEGYGEFYPADPAAVEDMPPGSENRFLPAPQMLSSGSMACEIDSLAHTIVGPSPEECLLEAKARKMPFYWAGEYTGLIQCRLYTACNFPQLEHGAEGELFGIAYEKVCAIANPTLCWTQEKRREFLTGFNTAEEPGAENLTSGSVPCMFESVLRACDRLQLTGLTGVEECGKCTYANTSYISQRQALPASFLTASRLEVSCHRDGYRGMLRGSSNLTERVSLTCVDGRWIDGDGVESMMRFTCEAGARVTSLLEGSLADQQLAGKGQQWWESHYGKVIRSWNGMCLAPDHGNAISVAMDIPDRMSQVYAGSALLQSSGGSASSFEKKGLHPPPAADGEGHDEVENAEASNFTEVNLVEEVDDLGGFTWKLSSEKELKSGNGDDDALTIVSSTSGYACFLSFMSVEETKGDDMGHCKTRTNNGNWELKTWTQGDADVLCKGRCIQYSDSELGRSEYHNEIYNGGKKITTMKSASSSVCFLNEVGFKDNGGTDEYLKCQSYISGGTWYLKSESKSGSDADAHCGAVCLTSVPMKVFSVTSEIARTRTSDGCASDNLGSTSDRYCFLTKFHAQGTDKGDEYARCYIAASSGKWYLKSCTNDHDSTTECGARCIKWTEHTGCQSGQYSRRRRFWAKASGNYCTDCAAGKYSAGGQQQDCTPCAKGTAQGSAKESSCSACPEGEYASSEGLKSCSSCGAGSDARRRRANSCNQCDAGKYKSKDMVSNGKECQTCAAGYFSPAGSAACQECPLDTRSDAGASSCTACGPSQYAPTKSYTCYDCPCSKGITCTCSLAGGFLWQAEVPVRSSGTPYQVVVSFAQGSNTAGCRLMDQPLVNKDVLGDSIHFTSTVRVQGSGSTGTIKIHAEDQAACEGMLAISVAEPTQASWGACRETGRDSWRILPAVSAPGRGMLQFVGSHMCTNVGTGMMSMCEEANIDVLIPMDGLAGEVHLWTLSEHGNIEHPCGGVGTKCQALSLPIGADNTLSNLASTGIVGDAEMMTTFLTAFSLKAYENTYKFSYWATDAVFKAEECKTATTSCLTVTTEQLYQLEAHAIQCGKGEALQFFEFRTCAAEGGGQGFQYHYKCCTIQGIGGCENENTPWAERDETDRGPMRALMRQNITCEASHVLRGFVLEAKDPGDSNSEVRYDYECCAIAMWAPIAVHTEAEALNGTFDTFDGLYYPVSRSEGRIQMQSAFLYATQDNSTGYTLEYDKFTGEWCVKGLGAPEDCWFSEADHPLRLGFGGPFDISPIKRMDPNAGESDNGMKEIKVVKFKKPPRIEAPDHADVNIKRRSLNAFEASKELNAFDITTVAVWMPNAPNYRPYCALRDPKAWKTLSEAEEEESEDWGIMGRNDLDVLNSKENLKRTSEAMQPFHPCQRYFHDSSEVNRDAFVSKFDLSRLLTFDSIMSSRLVKHRATRKPKPPPQDGKWWPKKKPRKYSGLSGELNDAAKGLSPIMGGGMKKQDPSPKGLTPDVLGHCLARQSVREDRLNKEAGKTGIAQAVGDLAHMAATAICGFLPKTGIVAAPVGVGAETETDWALICEKIANNVHAVYTDVNQRFVTGREQWKLENDAMDDCSKFTAAQMYKVFCDLHCLEDEVLKGNSAILRSLKGLETHVVKTVNDMLQHYTTEIFEKLTETQTQINHNDGEMSDILTDYVEQMMDQNTEYRDQLSDQMTTQINALSGQIGDFVVEPLNKLQMDIATVNENLITVNDWLRANEVLNPEESEELSMLVGKGNVSNHGNSSIGLMHTVFHNLQRASAELVHTIHSEDTGAFQGLNEERATAILGDLTNTVSMHGHAAKQAMSQRDLSSARHHSQQVVDAIHRARHAFASAKEDPAQTFARDAAANMLPTFGTLVTQTQTLGNMSVGLLSFASHQRAILHQATSFGELSDQAQHFAAADMMVRFDSAMAKAQRSLSDYLHMAKQHLHARADALLALSEATSPNSCNSPETLMQVGRSIFEAEMAEAKHAQALAGAWRDTASALVDVSSLLVDGGLLVHYMRLISSNEVGDANALADDTAQDVPKSIAEAANFAEKSLGIALTQHAGGFAQHVAHAFDMAEMLAHMWGHSALEAPRDELLSLHAGWGGVRQVALSLQKELSSDSRLRREMLLNHLSSNSVGDSRASALNRRFPPPAKCVTGAAAGEQQSFVAEAAIWSFGTGASGDKHVFLLGDAGRAWKCDEATGEIEKLLHLGDLPSMGSGNVDALGVEHFLKHLIG